MECPICKNTHEQTKVYSNLSGRDAYNVDCYYCLSYEVSGSLFHSLKYFDFPHTASSWIREENSQGSIPTFMSDEIEKLRTMPDLKISQKYERFIKYICAHDGEHYSNASQRLMVICWCKDNLELDTLFRKAEANKHLFIERDKDGQYFPPLSTYDAREFVENLGYKTNSNKIFMAFHFTSEMNKQFEATVKRAVLDASNGKLEAVRVSSSTTEHDTKIDDELISMIKASKAVIADFTGQRNAVYYEAGYAMGMGIPVIWTCRASDVGKLSFDTRQYPHIVWENEEDLYTQVSNRIKAKIL
ncbi:nucleoside 2-deoxyribosyltransferase [Sulfurospirillum oryzae]|uniref:nucleoside 2-deoxyribosyltransferase n=1 Tax=Sulfurospirillum oryzae TaxID=2976535 RepID=UPI0021E9AE43|nr:nucleoside 2-deoxyribosyltransferase [Sulfurospirillum oryzae]